MRAVSILCSLLRAAVVAFILLAIGLFCHSTVDFWPHPDISQDSPPPTQLSSVASSSRPSFTSEKRVAHYQRVLSATTRRTLVGSTTRKPARSGTRSTSMSTTTERVGRSVTSTTPALKTVGPTTPLHNPIPHNKNLGTKGDSPQSNVSFQLGRDFCWPQPRAVRDVRSLKNEEWLADMKRCLLQLPSREVVLLTSNQPYTEVLLNWLVAGVTRGHTDLSQIVVIAMDTRLHSLLEERGIVSVLVKPQSLLTPSALKEGSFPCVMMTRLAIMRLLNYWGYDVINFDTDAILLRDPAPLLGSRDDIIGTFGRFPVDLTKRWGITLCTAVLVVRSSPATEDYWKAVSRAAPGSFSDQGKMNYGLREMGVHWALPSRNLGSLSQPVQGECEGGLRVSLLPYNIACRAGSCTHKAVSAGLYVWHKGGARVGERKREGAQEGGAWLLRSDWTVGCGTKLGEDWLHCISIHS